MMVDNNIQIMDREGHVCRVFDFLKLNNVNSVRLRIWNEPDKVPESKGYCSLTYVLEMAHVIKNTNAFSAGFSLFRLLGRSGTAE